MTAILLGCADNRVISHWRASLGIGFQIKLEKNLNRVLEQRKSNRNLALIIIDYGLLADNYDESLSRLQLTISQSKVLLIGKNCSHEIQLKAYRRGILGYMESQLSREFLRKGVDRLLDGEAWVERHLVNPLLQTLREQKGKEEYIAMPDPIGNLTRREIEIARLICRGASNKKIANTLNITERTVKAHLTSIFKKLEVLGRLQLALRLKDSFSERQFIPAEDPVNLE